MAYTAPTVRSAGYLVTAAEWNANVVDNVAFQRGRPSCFAWHNANQAIPTATLTTVAFNSEVWDTDGIHDPVTNNHLLTIQTAGLWWVQAHGRFDTHTGIHRSVLMHNPGTARETAVDQVDNSTTAVLTARQIGAVVKCAVGDTFYLQVRHNHGSTINLLTLASYSPHLAAHWLGEG